MKLIIIGNGVAGTTTANLVGQARSEVDIAIHFLEPHHHYPRPHPVDAVAGEIVPERIISRSQDWHHEYRIDEFLWYHLRGPGPSTGRRCPAVG